MSKIPFQTVLFESFQRHPDRIAVEYGDLQVTYGELQALSNRVTGYLNRHRVEAGSFIGIRLEDRLHIIAAMTGILNARCVFVILDPQWPEKRIETLIRSTGINIVLESDEAGSKGEPKSRPYRRTPFPINGRGESCVRPCPEAYHREDNIYIYFTSGSTGTPKAILGKNKSLLHFIQWEIQTFGIDETYRISQLSAPGFDAFLRDVFTPLCAGGTVCIPGDARILPDREQLVHWLETRAIRLIHCVPSLLRVFNTPHLTPANFKQLKHILVSGEPIVPSHLKNWFVNFGTRIQLVNLYGPTETTMVKTSYIIREEDGEKARIPVGTAIKGSRVFVLNDAMEMCGPGHTGQVYIRTPFRSAGYYNDPRANEERFIPNPFTKDPNDLFHKTGDLGRFLPDGSLDILGRVDRQVKIRGVRVEPGEIETLLSNHHAVSEAVVTARTDTNGETFLCAYFVPESEIDEDRLRQDLAAVLPDYMMPLYFVPMKAFPLTPNGKIDRKALPEPRIQAGEDYIAPRNPLEKTLVEIWAQLLNLEKEVIGIDSHFFRMGGHSLKAAFMVEKVHQRLNVKLPLVEIFKRTTIRELARYLSGLSQQDFIPIEPVEKQDYYPLSPAQKRLYLLQQMIPGSISYNMVQVIPLPRETDLQRLEESFRQLIQRHESLRTCFVMVSGGLVQRVRERVEFKLETIDLAANRANKREKEFVRFFDLSKAPLVRVGVIQQEGPGVLIVVDMHHIISDGISMTLLSQDIQAIYGGQTLPPLRMQYKDFARWQNSEKGTAKLREQEQYWLDQFRDNVPVLDVPLDFPRPPERSFEGRGVAFQIGEARTHALNRLALDKEVTLYMVLMAALNVFLAKISRQEEIVIGAPVAGRRHADAQNIIGMFVNTLPIKNHPHADQSFAAFLQDLKHQTLGAFDNQDYQFEDLVETLDVARDTSRNPLFDVVYILQNFDEVNVAGDSDSDIDSDAETDAVSDPSGEAFENRTSRFDFSLSFIETPHRLGGLWQFSTKLFRVETIQRFIAYFKTIITQITQSPHTLIADIDMIPPEEKEMLLHRFNDTHREIPADQTIHGLFEAQASRTPDAIAFVGYPGQHSPGTHDPVYLSYRELDRSSDRLAALLVSQGVTPGHIVGLSTGRTLDMSAGILAILKTGAAYLPLDPDNPEERIRFMLEDSGVKVIVTTGLKVNGLEGFIVINPGDANEFPNRQTGKPTNRQTSLAYIIYTSGTTGRPKGTLIGHRGIVSLYVYFHQVLQVKESDRVLQFARFSFDASVWEMFMALLTGAALHIAGNDIIGDYDAFARYLERHGITIATLPPTFLVYLDPARNYSLRTLVTSGSEAKVDLVRTWSRRCEYINGYGPTETTVGATLWSTRGKAWSGPGPVPIGTPMLNTKVYILDKDHRLQPIGVPGECCVAGIGLARGYLNRPELTAEKFAYVSSPVNSTIYKTGDLARWLLDGNLEFLGRIDNQVKIRGFRVETGEIQDRLLKVEEVEEAAVIAWESPDGDKYLCAYVVLSAGEAPEALSRGKEVPPHLIKLLTEHLTLHLSRDLPAYMIPSFFMLLRAIPLTANGKVDFKSLPAPRLETRAGYQPPRDAVEEKVASIWRQVLKLDIVGITDDFFEVGGHSLKAIHIVNEIHKVFNIDIPLTVIFSEPTIEMLSRFIKAARHRRFKPIKATEKRQYYPLSSTQSRLYILQQTDPAGTAYNMPQTIPFGGGADLERLEKTLNRLIRRHESLRTSFIQVEGRTVQRVHDARDISLKPTYYDQSGNAAPLPPPLVRPFDLSKAPLLRAGLVKTLEGHHMLTVDIHHIVSDGVSQTLLAQDFNTLFNGYEPEPLVLHYKDFTQWQKEDAGRELIRKQGTYWLEQFRQPIPESGIPLDYPRPGSRDFTGRRVFFDLPAETLGALTDLASQQGITPYILFLALVNLLLAKLAGMEDIVVGTPVAARNHPDLAGIIGMFVNTLALRNFPGGELTFTGFLAEVKKRTFDAFENQDYPFEDLVDRVAPHRQQGRNPLFDVMFSFDRPDDHPGQTGEPGPVDPGHEEQPSKFDITFNITQIGERFPCRITYAAALYKESTIDRMIGRFKALAAAILENPQQQLSNISLIEETEKNTIIADSFADLEDE